MVGQEEAQGWTRHHLDGQAQLVAVGACPALDADQPAAMPVKPAAGLRRHLVGRRHIEQLPAALEFRKQPLAVRAKEAQIAVGCGKKVLMLTWPWVTIELNTPAIQAVEVQCRLVGGQAVAAAQDMAMGPEDLSLLGPQHHVAVIARKKRQRAAIFPFHFP